MTWNRADLMSIQSTLSKSIPYISEKKLNRLLGRSLENKLALQGLIIVDRVEQLTVKRFDDLMVMHIKGPIKLCAVNTLHQKISPLLRRRRYEEGGEGKFASQPSSCLMQYDELQQQAVSIIMS